jgi:hypothetical protein
MKKLLFAAIVTFSSLNVLAVSEAMKVHPLDADKDGLVSVDEAKIDSGLSAIFTDLDINQDGFLSPLELAIKTKDKTS